MGLKKDIFNYCFLLGIDSVGFIKCRKFNELEKFYNDRKASNLENEFEEHDIKKRINPFIYLEEGKTIISIAFPYLTLNNINSNQQETLQETVQNGFSVYTKGLDYHYVVNKYLDDIVKIIEKYGGKAEKFVDSNTLPERYIAYLAGIGFIGKNNLIITKKYGSYVFLGEIITDLEFYDEDMGTFDQLNLFKECGDCKICYNECPTKSINKTKKNCNICLSYLTQKKDLKRWEMEKLDGRIFGCDTCQNKCPYNQNIETSKIPEFEPLEFIENIDEDYIVNMTNGDFKANFKKTSCGWRGKNILKRNTLIRKAIYLKKINDLKNIKLDSPYLQEQLKQLTINNEQLIIEKENY